MKDYDQEIKNVKEHIEGLEKGLEKKRLELQRLEYCKESSSNTVEFVYTTEDLLKDTPAQAAAMRRSGKTCMTTIAVQQQKLEALASKLDEALQDRRAAEEREKILQGCIKALEDSLERAEKRIKTMIAINQKYIEDAEALMNSTLHVW